MAMAISTYSLDTSNNDLADQCTDVCNSGSTIIRGVEWIEGIDHDQNEDGEESDYSDDDGDADSEKEEDNRVLVWGEAAPSLSAGQCADVHHCSECRQSWYDNDLVDSVDYRCKDDTVYMYRNKCKFNRLNKEGLNLCMTGSEDYCHWSFPADDPLKGKSEEAACRTIPHDYMEDYYKFAKKPSKNQNAGLCAYGCEEFGGTCYWSWPQGEKKKNNPKAMHRCEIVEH